MTALGQYDCEMQMFVEAPHTADFRHLVFYRWLAIRGRCEHEVAGPSSGEYSEESPPRAVPLLDYSGRAR